MDESVSFNAFLVCDLPITQLFLPLTVHLLHLFFSHAFHPSPSSSHILFSTNTILPTSTPHFPKLNSQHLTSPLSPLPSSPHFYFSPLPIHHASIPSLFTSFPFLTPSQLPSPSNSYFFSTLHLTTVLRPIPLHSDFTPPLPPPHFNPIFFVFFESFRAGIFKRVWGPGIDSKE